MANSLLTIDMVTNEGLRVLKNSLGFTSRVTRKYDKEFGRTGGKIGDKVRVRKPPRYVGRFGDALSPEATVEQSVDVVIDKLFGVDTEFTESERVLSLDNYSGRVLKPKMATIANRIDRDGLELYKKVYNAVGTPGTVPTSFETYVNASAKLDDNCAPQDDDRYVGITSWMRAKLVTAGLSLFNPQADISRQFRKGRIGDFSGFEFYDSQNMPTHTFGAYVPSGAALEVKGAGQTGSSLLVDGYTSASHKVGDVFTIEGVYGVNPQSRESTGQLQQFVITADATYSATDLTLSISPSIIISGQFQNVTNAPADNADITFDSSTGRVYKLGLAFHREFATLVTVQQEMVKGVHECSFVSDPDSGLSIRSVTFYDGVSNKMMNRMEVMYGWATLYEELACRINS